MSIRKHPERYVPLGTYIMIELKNMFTFLEICIIMYM